MFRSFGHSKSSIVNGGLPRWVDEGLPIDTEAPTRAEEVEYPAPTSTPSQSIRSEYRCHCVVKADHVPPYPSGYEDMITNSAFNPKDNAHAELVLDARSRGR